MLKKKHRFLIVLLVLVVVLLGCLNFFKNVFHYDSNNQLNKVESCSLSFSSIDYILNTNICIFKKPRIVILITSHVLNKSARRAIRKSYPRDLFRQHDAQIIFLLAQQNDETQISVQKEFIQFNDMIQGNFTEAYRNLTYKHYMGLKWSQDYCSSTKYIVKMDDDIVVNYYILFEVITQFKRNFQLMGHIIENMKPIRDISNKWYVTKKEYVKNIYPSFLSGWIYVATSTAVELLLRQISSTNFFWIDDVFITGILKESAKINLTDIKQYFRYEPESIKCCVKNKYSCHFLAAPSGKNYQLHINLNNHLWRCRYKKVCTLESNMKTSCLLSNNFISIKGYLQNVTNN